MRFMLRVEVADATAEWAAIGEPLSLPGGDGAVTWVDPWPHVAPGGPSYADAASVEVADATAEWAAIGEPLSLPGGDGAVTWVDPWPHVAPGGTSYADAASAEAEPRPWRLVLVPLSLI